MSSYNNKITYKNFFQSLVFLINPKLIVEFGILDGFSLDCWKTADCKVLAYDIFENFNGNHAKRDIINKYKIDKNIIIDELDFYTGYTKFKDNSIDILHIDIANTAKTYEHALQYYMKKMTYDGIMILEGGSSNRDEVYWMNKYNKKKINPFLQQNKFKFFIIDSFPSCTIIKRQFTDDEINLACCNNNIHLIKKAYYKDYKFNKKHLNCAIECESIDVIHFFLKLKIGNKNEIIEWAKHVNNNEIYKLILKYKI